MPALQKTPPFADGNGAKEGAPNSMSRQVAQREEDEPF